MRQHITEEQLKELSDIQRQKLLDWSEKRGWYPQFTRPTLMLHTFDKYLSDCIGVGQMIEFLGDGWWRRLFSWDYGSINCEYESENKELCDALWEAVKDVL